MKKILIGLTIASIKQIVTKEREYMQALTRLKQHRILFSAQIQKSYAEFFSTCDLSNEFHQWYAYFARYDDFFMCENSQKENFEDELVCLLNNSTHSILIKHHEIVDNSHSSFSIIELDEINQASSDNELCRQCIPTNFILKKDSSKADFCNWLSELLADEQKITIVDKYILSDEERRKILEKIYIPTFPIDAKIDVYFGDNEQKQSEISAIKRAMGDRIHLYSSKSSTFHERHIICNSFFITIGVGLDVFVCNSDKSRMETAISVSNNANGPTLPQRSHQR